MRKLKKTHPNKQISWRVSHTHTAIITDKVSALASCAVSRTTSCIRRSMIICENMRQSARTRKSPLGSVWWRRSTTFTRRILHTHVDTCTRTRPTAEILYLIVRHGFSVSLCAMLIKAERRVWCAFVCTTYIHVYLQLSHVYVRFGAAVLRSPMGIGRAWLWRGVPAALVCKYSMYIIGCARRISSYVVVGSSVLEKIDTVCFPG